ncbi:MAG TPA: DegV family protein [Terrisporobacter glycolicus]|uniref:Fatty acid-binding protein n=1 Tax=Terrisporobacter petrolearius TaxID=1460447 RepID=A0ABZ3FG58_9FIRM|nr:MULTISPECIES: DegV family protein [Terrisporobacter]HBI93549.1 DegV family protein [Terrisporobacter hibernicus]
MSDLKIICDSLADVPKNLVKLYDIEVIPLTIIINETEYKDGQNLTNEEFYKLIKEYDEIPKTSQATYIQFKEIFKKYLDQGKKILYISGSSKVTGTYQSAMITKNDLQGEIHIFDSLNLSYGCGAQVVTACEMNEQGKSIEDIVKKLEEIRDNILVLFAVDNLDYLKKGGRLSASKAAIGSMLSIKPILQMQDGLIVNIDQARGHKKVISKLISITKEHFKNNIEDKRIGIAHGDNEVEFEKLKEAINSELKFTKITETKIGPSIGSHTGAGTIGLCMWNK